MKRNIEMIKIVVLVCVLLLIPAGMAFSAAPVASIETNGGGAIANNVSYCQVPPSISNPVPPLVMTMIERDERLFRKAYDDVTDLDGDGTIDREFNNNIDYYGYFDSYKCYTYATTAAACGSAAAAPCFTPSRISATKACNTNGTAVLNEWSGNFLNWATMTRIDIMRKALVGGYRKYENANSQPYATLQRAIIPPDSHSFVKTLNNASGWVQKVTPFTVNVGLSNTDAANTFSFCSFSNAVGGAPLMRVASGTYQDKTGITPSPGFDKWASANRWQCAVQGEAGTLALISSCGFEGNYCTGELDAANSVATWSSANPPASDTGQYVQLKKTSGHAYISYSIPTVVGQSYTVQFWARPTTSGASGYCDIGTAVKLFDIVGDMWISGGSTTGTQWNLYKRTFTATTATTWLNLTVWSAVNTVIEFDEFKVFKTVDVKTQGGAFEPYRPSGAQLARAHVASGEYSVRAVACNPNLLGKERCRKYEQKGNYMPIGLFQQYGEDSSMYFGVMTPSYNKNKAGGILRSEFKDVGDSTSNETNRTTGVFTSNGTGIPNTLNKLRIADSADYDWTNAIYQNCPVTFANGECRDWGNPLGELYFEFLRYLSGNVTQTVPYNAASAGDPLAFTTWNAQLDIWTGTKPKSACAPIFALTFSDPYPSFDSSEVPGGAYGSIADDRPGSATSPINAESLATSIGALEGINGGNFFMGDDPGDGNPGQCTSKNIASLGQSRGICPEAPASQGSYYLPALAYYANTHDLRTSTLGVSDVDGTQNVAFYALALGSNRQGAIEIKVKDAVNPAIFNTVTVMPACYNNTTGKPCAMVGFRQSYSWTSGEYYGAEYYVDFEAKPQGSDYSMDVEQHILYAYNPTDNTVYISTQIAGLNPNSADSLKIGFIIEGTTADTTADPLNYLQVLTPSSTGAWSKTFNVGPYVAKFVKDPLWLAAKYGGFEDGDGDGVLDTTVDENGRSEWDSDGDKVPDTYFLASNPLKMEDQLVAAFTKILARVTSGTSAAVIAEKQGSGANLVQAVYYPRRRFKTQEPTWVGTLQNLWYYQDPFFSASNVREDTNDDKKLTLTQDYIVHLGYDPESKTTEASLFQDANGDNLEDTGLPFTTVNFDDTKVLWEAGKQLWARDVTADPRHIYTTIDKANFYNFNVANKATLKPFLNVQEVGDGVAGTDLENEDLIRWTLGETVLSDRNGTDTDGDGVGDGDAGFDLRLRSADIDLNGDGDTYDTVTMDINGDGVDESVKEVNQWKLGDIITSTPKIQASFPLAKYDVSYNDTTYAEFYSDTGSVADADSTTRYKNRGIIYSGANDGMLHAFKLGRLDLAGVDYVAADPAEIAKLSLTNADLAAQNYFGKEMWAYIPLSGLPYLRFIAQNDYCHVNVVDLTSSVVDASVARPAGCGSANPADCLRTKESWRTVLIGGMRLGGSCRAYSATQDANCAGSADKNCLTAPLKTTVNGVANTSIGYSAYFAIDVTDPENPSLLWEYWHDDLGFSTTGPAVVRINGEDDDGVSSQDRNGNWFVVFGTGPTGPINSQYHQFMGRSDKNLKYQVLDLYTGTLKTTIDTGLANSFSGSLVNASIDLDVDYQDDVLYAGYVRPKDVSGTTYWIDGGVGRIVTSENPDPAQWRWSKLIDGVGPVTAGISKLLNTNEVKMSGDSSAKQHLWVYFGTGRFYYKTLGKVDDYDETNANHALHQRALFGITDPCFTSSNSTTKTVVFDPVCTDNTADNELMNTKASLFNTTDTLQSTASTSADKDGWFINLSLPVTDAAGTTFANERVVTDATTTTSGYALFTSTAPSSASSCGIEGTTTSWAVKYDTGGLPAGIKGVMLVQTSTGAITQIDLAEVFAETREYAGQMPGLASSDAPALSSSPPPVKRSLHIMER